MTGVLPCLIPPVEVEPGTPAGPLGDPLLDAYLEFVAARSRPNTVLATWFDLKVFFAVVGKPVGEVRPVDVLGFITAQRAGLAGLPDPKLVPVHALEEGAGVSLRTIRRRLSTIGGPYAFLTVRGDVAASPVPADCRPVARPHARPKECRWCERPGPCHGSCRRARSTHSPRRCARTATGPWSRPCSWVGCGDARSSG